MLLKLSDLSLELNLSLEWSTNLREWERRKGELSLLFRRATGSQKMCSIRVAPSETKETSTYSVAPEVPVPGTRTSGPSISDRWRLDPSRSDHWRLSRSDRCGGSDPPELPPKLPVKDRKWILTRDDMRKGSYADFRSWTGTSGHGPELPVKRRKCFLKRERTSQSLTAQPELPPPKLPPELPVLYSQHHLKTC